MKSKIFLCLLLIVAILAFGACGNKENAAGQMEHAVDDVVDGMDDAVTGRDNGNFGSGNGGDARPGGDEGIVGTGLDKEHKISGGALAK